MNKNETLSSPIELWLKQVSFRLYWVKAEQEKLLTVQASVWEWDNADRAQFLYVLH